MTVAARLAVELLHCAPESDRAALLFQALTRAARTAGIDVQARNSYHGGSPWLLLWGPGAPNRFAPMADQLAAGGRVIAADLAYWNRERKIRISIDGPHPQRFVMAKPRSAARFDADPTPIRTLWDPQGPVLVAGIGEKATAQYGDQVATWEASQIIEARTRGRRVIYRPKKRGPIPKGLAAAPGGLIDTALRGVSLVITWHSNVAVDAIRLGIPALCRDGAAAAVCASTWPEAGMPQPLHENVRLQFLHNLAWFQWDPAREASQTWAWLSEVLS